MEDTISLKELCGVHNRVMLCVCGYQARR